MRKSRRLGKNLPIFEPADRYAILLNSYDYIGESPIATYTRGNSRIYELEAILSGEFFPVNLRVSEREIFDAHLHWAFGYDLRMHGKKRADIPYSVTRIFPTKTIRTELEDSLGRITDKSSTSTLTFVYITTHGESGGFKIGDGQTMSYANLLERLDRMKGKKVIASFGCYSGSLIDALYEGKNKEDYVVMTSTQTGELGINQEEDKLHDELMKNIRNRNRISKMKLPERLGDRIYWHHPQIVGFFDVVV